MGLVPPNVPAAQLGPLRPPIIGKEPLIPVLALEIPDVQFRVIASHASSSPLSSCGLTPCGFSWSSRRFGRTPMKKYKVTLTAEERQLLLGLIATGKAAAKKLTHARILLKADAAEGGPGWDDQRIAEAAEVSTDTVARVRQRFVEHGLEAA